MDSPKSEQPSASQYGPARRPPWSIYVAGAVLMIVVIAVAAVEIAPRPVAASLIRDWLKARGARATITVTTLTDRGMTAGLIVGDPRDPDLSIDRVEIAYALTGPWNGQDLGVTPRSVRLVRPRLKLRLVNGAPDFGALSGVVRWVQAQPPSSQPLPDLTIDDGRVVLLAPGGVLRVDGLGMFSSRRSGALTGRIQGFRQVSGGVVLTSAGGPIQLNGDGRRVTGHLGLGPTTAVAGDRRLEVAALDLTLDLPSPDASGRWRGPMRLDLTTAGAKAATGSGAADHGNLGAHLSGSLDASTERQSFTGAGAVDGALVTVTGSTLGARDVVAAVSLPTISLSHDAKTISTRANGEARLSMGRLVTNGVAASDLSIRATIAKGWLLMPNGANLDGGASLVGQVMGRGGVTPAEISRIVATLPLVSGERPYAAPLAAALRNFKVLAANLKLDVAGGRARLVLAGPARIDTASGARLTLSGQGAFTPGPAWLATGSANLALEGGGLPTFTLAADNAQATPVEAQAHVAIQARFTSGPIEDAAMNLQGHLRAASGHVRLDLDDCGLFSARRLGSADQAVDAVSLRLCPGAGPLVDAAAAGWAARGRIEALRGDAKGPAVGVRDTDIAFDIRGSSTGPRTADISLIRASLLDQSSPSRFAPLGVSGALALDHDVWRGDLTIAGSKGRRLGKIKLNQAQTDGSGRVDIDIDGLDFAPGQSQPTDLTPLAASVRDTSGHLGFTGWLSWTGKGEVASGGELNAKALAFASPLGRVENLTAQVRFASLTPPTTGPGQTITVAAIQTVTPLTNLTAAFHLGDKALHAERVTAAFAGGTIGVEPANIPFAADGAFSSAMVLHQVDIGTILDATNLSDKVKVQAKVDGRIPFTVGPGGLTIQSGSLTAGGGGRLSISRAAFEGAPGSPATAVPATSFAQDFAYQAMENLAFDSMDATLNSQAHDRLGILFHIKGRHDPPTRTRAVFGLMDVLQGKALAKPVPLPSGTKIDLTLDTSLNFGELVGALQAAWNDAVAPIREALPASPAQGTKAPAKTEGRTEQP